MMPKTTLDGFKALGPLGRVDALFDAALVALRDEDVSLQDCFKKSDSTVAHGLTYWLFETTLVYFIFKAWLPRAEVFWEHAIDPDAARRPSAIVVGRAGAHENVISSSRTDRRS